MVAATPVADPGEQASLPASVAVGGAALPTWPAGQAVAPMSARLMGITLFTDHGAYHSALIEATLSAEGDTGRAVPVRLRARVTDFGTLELWCVAREDDRRWKVELNVRQQS